MSQPSITILNFHGLGDPPTNPPASEAKYWLKTDKFTAILDAVGRRADVQLTFDDANESDYALALPLLQHRKLTARFFIVAGRVDKSGYLSSNQIQALRAEGMGIGSHGLHHRPWTQLSEPELKEEIVEAKDRLEQIISNPVTEAACPFGRYNRRVLQRLNEAGFRRVFNSDGGRARPQAWLQARYSPVEQDAVARLLAMVDTVPSGPAAWWRQCWLTAKRWL